MYDVVVVGSGYAGCVMAARVSAHANVLLVERGKRWQPGQFPRSVTDLVSTYKSKKRPLGLWAMRLGPGTGNAFVSGLGGASLVNYGITARPDDHVFDERWAFSARELDPYFERARGVLKPSKNPVAESLADHRFLDFIEPGTRFDFENTIDWSSCTQCGRCCPGCNIGAKRSLDKTYLPIAEENGAEIRVETELAHFEKLDSGGWRVVLRHPVHGTTDIVQTRHLVLSAGTFGTLDLLHRQRDNVPVTKLFGQRMTMNGDGVAFLYNTEWNTSTHHGAPITTSVRLPFTDSDGRTRTLSVMSGRLPFSIIRVVGAVMSVVSSPVLGKHVGPRGSGIGRVSRRLRDLISVGSEGAMSRTFMYKLDAEDSNNGKVIFDSEGRSAVDWPDYADDPILRFSAERLDEWAERIGGVLIRNLGTWPGMKSYGVHPLGGCRLGTSPDDGVVDRDFRLMRPDGTTYDGLRVVDASVIPSSLGVPSSYTVSALAERAAESLIGELARAA